MARAAEYIVARLRRKTSGGAFIPELDGLRFVAIALVVLVHLLIEAAGAWSEATGRDASSSIAAAVLANGAVGVALFFVLSGFILGIPFLRETQGGERVELGAYFKRRVTRLEPPYLLAVAISSAVVLATTPWTLSTLWPHIITSAFYVHELVFPDGGNPVNAVFWSLELEIQFYLLAPFLARFIYARDVLSRRAILVGGIALCAVNPLGRVGLEYVARVTVFGHLHYFLAGFLVADLYLNWHPARERMWSGVAAVGLVLLLAAPSFAYVLIAPAALLLALGTFWGRAARRAASLTGVTLLGGMCYSIYLLHNVLLGAIVTRTAAIGTALPFTAFFVLQVVLVLPLLLLPLVAFYAIVERPCMDRDWPARLRRWLTREEAPLPAAQPDAD